MATSDPSARAARSAEPLPASVGLGELAASLREHGALGFVVVDASRLGAVERGYGLDAHRRVRESLAAAVLEASAGERGAADRLVQPDSGADELALALFRPCDDRRFWAEGLAALGEAIGEHLAKQGARLFYPFCHGAPLLPVGTSIALRNPVLDDERQLRASLREARADAALAAEVARRWRRREFLELLLAEDVTVLFEPIVNLTTREVLGREALVRGPVGSALQTPGAFFERAEEAELLFEADTLCRRRALASARGLAPGQKLFLNCLPSAIRDPSFHGATLRRTLEHLHLRPTDVVFEISERESIHNFAIFREARDHFASLGLGIALDDMGAGYSSLEAVIELSPDFIKVDQSLVRSIDADPARQELLRSLNGVAAKLGARIIAEGIETSEELRALEALGVPLGQGYLLGRAAPLRRDA